MSFPNIFESKKSQLLYRYSNLDYMILMLEEKENKLKVN
jgi:hypothetical protein